MNQTKFIEYNGRQVLPDWPDRIVRAQLLNGCQINKEWHFRIRYGVETGVWPNLTRSCHDCAVEKGQLHVPGCDAEQCPVCRLQLFACDCEQGEMALLVDTQPAVATNEGASIEDIGSLGGSDASLDDSTHK